MGEIYFMPQCQDTRQRQITRSGGPALAFMLLRTANIFWASRGGLAPDGTARVARQQAAVPVTQEPDVTHAPACHVNAQHPCAGQSPVTSHQPPVTSHQTPVARHAPAGIPWYHMALRSILSKTTVAHCRPAHSEQSGCGRRSPAPATYAEGVASDVAGPCLNANHSTLPSSIIYPRQTSSAHHPGLGDVHDDPVLALYELLTL